MAKKAKAQPTTTGQYDKIFKENIEEIYNSLIKTLLLIDTSTAENVEQRDLQKTIERKADFLKKILPQDGSFPYILHIEIQSENDEAMLLRMDFYDALIAQKYQIDCEQFVIYIGNEPLQMPDSFQRKRKSFSYQIIDIRRYDYEHFLKASSPEEVILAILGNFQSEKASTVIERILLRLRELTSTQLALGKYANQLGVIAKLRKLQKETLNQIENMPLTFDITDMPIYIMGEAKGEAIAMKKAVFGMFIEGLSLAAIQRISGLPIETIQAWQKEWEDLNCLPL